LPGSGTSRGQGEEQGKLIRFPRSSWVPEDGIEPLNGDGLGEHSAGYDAPVEIDGPNVAEHGSTWPGIEAGDFWASGDTQEFVGVASAAGDSTQGEPQVSPATRTRTNGELCQQLLRTPLVGAAVAVTVMAGGGVAAWRLISAHPDRFKSSAVSLRADHTASSTHRVTTDSAASTNQQRSNTRGKQRHTRPPTHGKSRANRRAPSSSHAPKEVSYQSSRPTYPQPTQSSSQTAAYTGSPSTRSAVTSASAASAGGATQSSQPTFGANGALGPMSSSAG
jgi:hypothetical protein